MGRLTTHILDTASGRPAHGVEIVLFEVLPDGKRQITRARTNEDGRVDGPIAEGRAFANGVYELEFHVGDYFGRQGLDLPAPKFLDVVVLRFGIAAADQHYHVPLLVSPYGYSTYRGS